MEWYRPKSSQRFFLDGGTTGGLREQRCDSLLLLISAAFQWPCVNCSFPGSSAVKNPPEMQDMWIQSLGREDPQEKEMKTHSSTLAWEIPFPRQRGDWQATIHRVPKELDTT